MLRRLVNKKSYSYYNINQELLDKCEKVRSSCRVRYWRGKKRSKETILKMSKKLIGIDKGMSVIDTKTGEVFSNINRAAEANDLHPETLRCYLNGKRVNKTSLQYVDESKRNTHFLNKNGRR